MADTENKLIPQHQETIPAYIEYPTIRIPISVAISQNTKWKLRVQAIDKDGVKVYDSADDASLVDRAVIKVIPDATKKITALAKLVFVEEIIPVNP